MKSVRSITSAYSKAKVYELRLELTNIIPLSRLAVHSRVDRAQNLLVDALRSKLKIFETMVLAEGEGLRIVFPPVVEVWRNGFYLVDGVHRMLAAIKMEYSTEISVVGVKSDNLPPLPCEPSRWGDIRVIDKQKQLEDIFPSLDRSLFRPVSKYFNGEHFIFSSLQELVNRVNGTSKESYARRIRVDKKRRQSSF
jgi:hypothetical protein